MATIYNIKYTAAFFVQISKLCVYLVYILCLYFSTFWYTNMRGVKKGGMKWKIDEEEKK